jgi:hypothetical protein
MSSNGLGKGKRNGKREKSTVRIAVIPSETKRFRLLTAEEVEPYMRRVTRIGKRNRKTGG